MKNLYFLLLFLPVMSFGFNLDSIDTAELPAGVYYLPLPSSIVPNPFTAASTDHKTNFETYVAKIVQEKVDLQPKTNKTPLLNSIRIYCSDEYFLGKRLNLVSKGEWLNCLTQMATLVKYHEGKSLLYKLIHTTILDSLEKWQLTTESFFEQSGYLDPLGLNPERVKVTLNLDGKILRVDLKLRLHLYKTAKHFISNEKIEEYYKMQKGPYPASSD